MTTSRTVPDSDQATRIDWLRSRAYMVWPYLLLTLLLGLVAFGGIYPAVVMWEDNLDSHVDYPGGLVWLIGGLATIVLSGAIGFLLYRRGLPIARKLSQEAEQRQLLAAAAPPAPTRPIGHTNDGQAIYPVLGYTAGGKPVTADRAVGLQPPQRGTNGLAIAALILAFAIAPVGLVLGFVARSQIDKSGQQGSGLALAAIIVGAVFTVINIATFLALAAMMGL